MSRRAFVLVMIVLLLCFLSVSVSAEATIDLNAKGSITVKAIYKKSPLEGMELNCIQVGDVVLHEGSYVFKSLYNDKILIAEDIRDPENPEEMLKHVTNSADVGITKSVDKSGYVKFDNLSPGLYLIYQTKTFSRDGEKFKIKEFFVSIPYDGKYDVDAKSKPGLDMYPEQPTEPTAPPSNEEKLPQTGQLSWPVPILAFSGIAIFILGWSLRFGGRKDAHEK